MRKPALEHTVEDWRHVLDLNLVSVAAQAQAAGRRMVEQGDGGAILLMASQLSFFGGMNTVAYAASKGGVAQLTKALSNELAGHGIRVNALAPGFIETEMTADIEDWKRAPDRRQDPDGALGDTGGRRRRGRLAPVGRRALRHRRDRPGGRRLPGALSAAQESVSVGL